MREQREPAYTFTSEEMLSEFFSRALPRAEIESVVETVRKGFIKRPGMPSRAHRLQFIKKCELELLRRARRVAP
jgi:hypothetical protein